MVSKTAWQVDRNNISKTKGSHHAGLFLVVNIVILVFTGPNEQL